MELSSYTKFTRKLFTSKGKKSLGSIGLAFDKEVDKNDYEEKDRDMIITYLHKTYLTPYQPIK